MHRKTDQASPPPNLQQKTILCYWPYGVELCSTLRRRATAPSTRNRTYLPGGNVKEKPEESHNQVVQMNDQSLQPPWAPPARPVFSRQVLPTAATPASILGTHPENSPTCSTTTKTLLMPLNAHHLFSIHPINSPPLIFSLSALRHGATSHLYANYFATWTKVIMLSDRKLTGLKSKMEINKLTPLNDRQDGHACRALSAWWVLRSLHWKGRRSRWAASCPGCVH